MIYIMIRYTHKNNSGFTLIELMIVIAIIGILMAYAIPAYRDYTVRSKAGEGIVIGADIKRVVSEIYHTEGQLPNSNIDAGIGVDSGIKGANIDSVSVGNGGVISVSFNNLDSTLSGKKVFLTPSTVSGAIKWRCSSDLEDRFMPSSCR